MRRKSIFLMVDIFRVRWSSHKNVTKTAVPVLQEPFLHDFLQEKKIQEGDEIVYMLATSGRIEIPGVEFHHCRLRVVFEAIVRALLSSERRLFRRRGW